MTRSRKRSSPSSGPAADRGGHRRVMLRGQLPRRPAVVSARNVLTEINYPFNERLSKLVRFLPRMADYDCGSSAPRAPPCCRGKAKGYRCFNMAVSDGQASEYLLSRLLAAAWVRAAPDHRRRQAHRIHGPSIAAKCRISSAPARRGRRSSRSTYRSMRSTSHPHPAGDAPHHVLRQGFRRHLEVRAAALLQSVGAIQRRRRRTTSPRARPGLHRVANRNFRQPAPSPTCRRNRPGGSPPSA